MVTNTQRYWLRELWHVSGFLVLQKGMDFYLWIVLSLASAVWKRKKNITSSHSGKMQSLPVPLFPTLNLPSTNPRCHHTLLGQIHRSTCAWARCLPSVALQGPQCCCPCPACASAGARGQAPRWMAVECWLLHVDPWGPPALAHHRQVCFHD